MNLYLIARPNTTDWDQYSSAVVVAESADDARNIHPRTDIFKPRDHNKYDWSHEWVSPSEVLVTYLGPADPWNPSLLLGSVVCASYHAG